jgi:hypothetical protein
MKKNFVVRDFIIITLITSIWVNISELIRYLPYVRPEMMDYLSTIPHMGEMNLRVALIWGFFDTLLTALYVFSFWLCAQAFGNGKKAVLISGLMSWSFFFVLFWVGSANMYVAEWKNLLVVLPLALLETLVASSIASKLYAKKSS